MDDHHRIARVDRHLRDAEVRHAPGDRRDGLVPACELDPAGLELQQLAHRAEAMLGAEKAHVAHPLVVVALAEIAIAGVGDDHHDGLAGTQATRDVERAVDRGAGGPAREDALAPRELARGEERILVRDFHDLVDDREVEGPHHEVVADPFDPVDAGVADVPLVERVVVHAADRVGARDEQRPSGLGRPLLEVFRRSRDRAAGADAADQRVEHAAGLLPELRTGGQIVGFGVVHVEVLVGVEAAGGLRRDALGDLPRSSPDGRAADRCG